MRPDRVAERRPVRIGIGGPVGSGKTALVAALCRSLGADLELAVVTNDIHTDEDAEFLKRAGVLDPERITAVQTGCCPHTGIRDDISANLAAVETLERRWEPLDLVLVESGADNHRHLQLRPRRPSGLRARRGGWRQGAPQGWAGGDQRRPAGDQQDRLATMVGADLGVMAGDAAAKRGARPVILCSLVEDPTAVEVAGWERAQLTG